MRKSARLSRLAVYADVGAASLCPTDREWDDLAADEFIALMVRGRRVQA